MRTVKTVEQVGRVRLLRVDDVDTPYIFELETEEDSYFATPACAAGEGTIEDQELTSDEAAFVRRGEY